MLTSAIVVLLLLLTLAYAAVPLFARRAVDPLPDDRDPLLVDLEEERDALLRAIRELDGRADLEAPRREALRARYEAKAAQVLRALEARRTSEASGRHERAAAEAGRRAATRRAPWGALGLLGLAAATAASLGTFVLPRVGQGTVTTFFESDLRAATELRDLQRAADADPSVANLMALGEAYWNLQDAVGAESTYRRVVTVATQSGTFLPPALAYKRLALLTIPTDLAGARDLLLESRNLDPADPETLFALGELSFALGDLDVAADAFRAYLATPQGADDLDAEARLALVEAIGPATEALTAERSAANLMALADVYWANGAQDPAVELYFEVLTDHDAFEPTALARTGQLLFVRGRTADAVAVLERAAAAAGGLRALEPQATLFLGNGYAVLGDDAGAVRAWEAHVDTVGEAAAGRVPELLAAARTRLAGGDAPVGGAAPAVAAAAAQEPAATATAQDPTADATADPGAAAEVSAEDRARAALDDPAQLIALGAELYAAHCAVCHGVTGQGGAGPRLAGNARAGNEANVRSAIRFGRGIMPGFGARLSEPEIDVLVRWTGQELASPR